MAITEPTEKPLPLLFCRKYWPGEEKRAFTAGNIGIALATLVDEVEDAVIAVEVSSFQLETAVDFRPHICGILNITPDHLDRHQSMRAYVEAKAKIFQKQRPEDYAVFNYEDPILRELGPSCPARLFYFSAEQPLSEGAFVEDNHVTIMVENKKVRICPLNRIKLRGKHNLENVLCAAMMAYLGGIAAPAIAEVLSSFKG